MAVFTQHFPLPENNLPTIPMNLFQTWHSMELPPHMKACVESLKQDNPEFTHQLFDDQACREFIRDKFPPDVLHAYDSLYPGAYKADLWRYCVLYVHGGIYVDIKLRCIYPFKLIQLATKERYVRDREYHFNLGVYQACLISYPNNPILYTCIRTIVDYVRTLEYGDNVLFMGPMLMSRQFDRSEILSWEMSFNGKEIRFGNTPIMGIYSEFIKEFTNTSITPYYMEAWAYRKAYKLVSLPPQKKYDLPTHSTNVQRIYDTLYFQLKGEYVQENGVYVSSNTTVLCQVKINDTYDFIEDVEYFKDPIKTSTVFSTGGMVYHLVSDADTYQFLVPTQRMISASFKLKSTEPLWASVPYENLHFVYEWYPLVLIQLLNGILTPLPPTYDTPRFFKEMVAATHMVSFRGQLWCILTKTHQIILEQTFKKYAHLFVVFDSHMKLIKYSEFFILGSPVSKISDLQIDEHFTIAYTTHNGQSFISEYSYDDIQKLRWTY